MQKLQELSNLNHEIENILLGERLNKVNYENELIKKYAPITKVVEESSKKIVGTIESSDKNQERRYTESKRDKQERQLARDKKDEELYKLIQNPRLVEVINLLDNYPNVVEFLKGNPNVDLKRADGTIIDLIEKLPEDQVKVLVQYFKQEPEKVEEVILEKKKEPSFLYKDIVSRKYDLNEIEKLGNKQVNQLINDVAEFGPKDFKKGSKWDKINGKIPGFIDAVKKKRKSASSGSGIHFLSSDINVLVNELNRAIGSFRAGNKNAYNIVSAICDEIRRKRRDLMPTSKLREIHNYMHNKF